MKKNQNDQLKTDFFQLRQFSIFFHTIFFFIKIKSAFILDIVYFCTNDGILKKGGPKHLYRQGTKRNLENLLSEIKGSVIKCNIKSNHREIHDNT